MNKVALGVAFAVTLLLIVLFHTGRRVERFSAPPPFTAAVIHLESNPDRLAAFKERYAKSDMATVPVTYIVGVDASKVDIMPEATQKARLQILDVERKGYRTRHEELTRGAVGCFLGHMKVYRRMLETGDQAMLVFEDDSSVGDRMRAQVTALLAKAPRDWDAIFLGHTDSTFQHHDETFDTFGRLFGMHCYLIRRSFAENVLQDVDKVDRQIDSRVTLMIRQGKLKVYSVRGLNHRPRDFGTQIQTLGVRPQAGRDVYELVEDPGASKKAA